MEHDGRDLHHEPSERVLLLCLNEFREGSRSMSVGARKLTLYTESLLSSV